MLNWWHKWNTLYAVDADSYKISVNSNLSKTKAEEQQWKKFIKATWQIYRLNFIGFTNFFR